MDQFQIAYGADYVTPDGKLVIDEPKIKQGIIKSIDSYTAIYRKGCTPPDSVTWPDIGNNKAFLAQSVVMTPNLSLSIPNALKSERPEDYYENTATIEWPLGPSADPFAIVARVHFGMAFSDGANVETAKEFVHFLVSEGWLAHYLNFSGERMLPSISKLLDQPFWLDPSDPHRMAAVMQAASRPLAHDYATASGDLRHEQIGNEGIWQKAIHRVVTEGITPRAGGRRGDRADQADPEGVSSHDTKRAFVSRCADHSGAARRKGRGSRHLVGQGLLPQEDEAVREIVAAFEDEIGKEVELVLHPLDEHPDNIVAALEAGQPPDFAFSVLLQYYIGQWAFEDRLVDLSDAVGHFSDLFDPEALDSAIAAEREDRAEGPVCAAACSLDQPHPRLEESAARGRLQPRRHPREWDAFWPFWCDRVQPAVRRATGRGDVWGVALPMSAGATDTYIGFYPSCLPMRRTT